MAGLPGNYSIRFHVGSIKLVKDLALQKVNCLPAKYGNVAPINNEFLLETILYRTDGKIFLNYCSKVNFAICLLNLDRYIK